jgi:hypothetical protein
MFSVPETVPIKLPYGVRFVAMVFLFHLIEVTDELPAYTLASHIRIIS